MSEGLLNNDTTPASGNGKAARSGSGRAIVVHPALRGDGAGGDRQAAARLDEAVGLALAIDLDVVAAEVVRVDKPRPSTLIGRGVVERLAGLVEQDQAALAVFDTALTPVQQRNLETALGCKVIDRTGLILEIFGARARTKEGQLQVELAALSYQRSRLVRSWTHLERQRGGAGFMGGPGERQIELDRRMLDDRIVKLKGELEQVRRTRDLHRKARRRVPYSVVALAGYTNAGKSTLFNRLTAATVYAEDQLFATLDPTMRRLRLPSGAIVILSDTVGFITDLPTDLVAAFRATLEEVVEADIILHVRDISHPETHVHRQSVEAVLRDLGIDAQQSEQRCILEVLNKIDLLDAESRSVVQSQAARRDDQVAVSAVAGEGIDALLQVIDAKLQARNELLDLTLDPSDGATLAWLYRHGRVLTRQDAEEAVRVTVSLSPLERARFERRKAETH